MSLRRLLVSTVFGVLAAIPFAAVNAAPIITVSTSPSFSLADLSSLAKAGDLPGFQNSALISFTGGTITFSNDFSELKAGVYQGSVTGAALTPYAQAAPSPDLRNYLVAQPNHNVVFQFDKAQTSFSLLWGTVDSYNSLQFGNQTVTGAQVAAAVLPGGTSPNGSTALYVSITGLDPFQTLTAIDIGRPGFEFVPGGTTIASLREAADPIPEPASLALLGCGLMGLIAVRARRTQGPY